MHCSLNQIENITYKAARGAGLHWGLADEVGKALRWLHAYRLDGVSALLETLRRHTSCEYSQLAPVSLCGKWRALSGLLDPLVVGVAVSDRVEREAGRLNSALIIHTERIAYPLLALGVLGNLAEIENLICTVSWSGVRVRCQRGNLNITAAPRASELFDERHHCIRIFI